MKLRLKNIGILRNAAIEVAGITVIAGGNDTGKSTVQKSLFAVLCGLASLDERVARMRRNAAVDALQSFAALNFVAEGCPWVRAVTALLQTRDLNAQTIERAAALIPPQLQGKAQGFAQELARIQAIDDAEIIRRIMQAALERVFRGPIRNLLVPQEAAVELQIGSTATTVLLSDDCVKAVVAPCEVNERPIFLDAFAVNCMEHSGDDAGADEGVDDESDEQLMGKLLDEKRARGLMGLGVVCDRLREICRGTLARVNGKVRYVPERMPQARLPLEGVSSGLKTFLMLQDLVKRGCLNEESALIFDAPEAHLHPARQVDLAEIIVLLQRELGLHVLLSSHSPYFISAIEAYSKKHGVIETNRYYFNHRVADGIAVEDVTDRIRVIYDSLAAPYQTIQDVFSE